MRKLKIKKNILRKIELLVLSLIILSLSLGLLTVTPDLVDMVQQSLASSKLISSGPENFSSQVAGVEKKKVVEILSSNSPPPILSALAAEAVDFDSGRILYQKNIHQKLLPASTTKLMTALVALGQFKSGEVLVVPSEALVGGSVMGLRAGEKISFRSLLYGMLLNSGNDAAFTLALNYPGGLTSFIQAMNSKAESLGLSDTHFTNPAGFDDPNHYSSAADLVKIAEETALDRELSQIVSTKETEVSSLDNLSEHFLHNLNRLLLDKGFIGIKTGFTKEAGENFVGLVDRGNHKILTVVLASSDRFGETEKLVGWVDQNFTWTETLR